MNEFDIIARYFAPLSKAHDGAFGLKDDAAVIAPCKDHELVITKDALIEGVHFLATDSAQHIASKLIRVNLSDLAAIGATPYGYILALMLPQDTPESWIAQFAQSLGKECAHFGGALLGGDTVTHSGKLSLSLTAIGQVKQGCALRRNSAKAGDIIYVSGTVGDSYLGLKALTQGLDDCSTETREFIIARYHIPQARVELGTQLYGVATACTDISDGLVADLGHLCDSSALGATIMLDAIPLSSAAKECMELYHIPLEALATGGDDYELLFTAPPEHSNKVEALANSYNVKLTVIGHMDNNQKLHVIDKNGQPINITKAGYQHST